MSGKALLNTFSALDDPRQSLNLIRVINDNAGLKVRRKILGWNNDYLYQALLGSREQSFKRFPWLRQRVMDHLRYPAAHQILTISTPTIYHKRH